jgi:TP901 family phage tail tape measure protein
MAVVGELLVLLGGNNTALTASLLKAEAQLKAFSTSATAHAGAGSKAMLGVGIAGAAVAAGVALIAGASITAASKFEEQMAIINTIARQTPPELERTGLAIRQLGIESGTALPDLTDAFYNLLSVGVPAAQAMDVLRNSVTLSIGGISTTTEAANAITAAINSWSIATGKANLTVGDSTKVTDIFAKSIEQGGFKAYEIAPALAQVSALAASMNVPLEEVGATWAILTTRGYTAATAATAMNSALVALQRVPPGMERLQEATGKSYEQIAKTQGAQAAMQALVTDAQKYGVQLIDVFGRQEALGYVLNVTGNAAAKYQSTLSTMYNATGAAGAQANERMGTFERQLKILGATIGDIGISIGTALLPALQGALTTIQPIVATVSSWIAANPQLASNILLVAGAAGVLAVVIAVLLNPIFLIAAAIAALGLAWANNWLGMRNIVTAVVGVIVAFWNGLVNAALLNAKTIGDIWNGLAGVFRLVATAIGLAIGIATGFIQALVGVVAGVAKVIADFFGWLFANTGKAGTELGALAGNKIGVVNPKVVGGSTPVPAYHGAGSTSYTPTTTTVGGVPVAGMFQHGGVVPGFGAQLVIAHGGETIIPPGAGAAGGINSVRHIHIEVGGRELLEYIDREMFGSASGFSSGFTSNSPVTGA